MPNDKQISVQQGALNTPTQDIYAGLLNCLQNYVAKLQDVANNPQQLNSLNAEIQDFLEVLGSISANCKERVQIFAQRNIPTSNAQYAAQLKKLLQDLIDDQRIYADIERMQARAHQEVIASKQQMSQQLKAALAEKSDVASKWHKAREDSAPHDPVRYIGDLLGVLLRTNYVVPVNEEYYVHGFEYNPRKDNSYEDHLRSIYGDSPYHQMKPR